MHVMILVAKVHCGGIWLLEKERGCSGATSPPMNQREVLTSTLSGLVATGRSAYGLTCIFGGCEAPAQTLFFRLLYLVSLVLTN